MRFFHHLRMRFKRCGFKRKCETSLSQLKKLIALSGRNTFLSIQKKNGELRPCIDYRGLNAITIKNKYPLPLISELFDRLRGAKIFTKLDLRGAYNLIRICEGDEWKTAFNTKDGHYEYLVMPFGLCNAPAVFQDFVNHIFRDMLSTSVVVYLDDILIFSPDIDSHRRDVGRVFELLWANSLYAKLEKCVLEQESLPFLGYIISAQGLAMDPAKLQAVMDWQEPHSLKVVQRFMGFINYYRQFIPHFSTLVAPLVTLTKKGANPKSWSEGVSKAFSSIKSHFASAPILHRPDVGITDTFHVSLLKPDYMSRFSESSTGTSGSSTDDCEVFVSLQLIQTVSAVDKDEPPRGHTFFFEMLPEFSINPNFTVVDNKDNTASILTKRNRYNRHKISAYTLPVIIFDNDYPVQSSTETLTIQVCSCDNKGNVQTCSAEAFFLPAGLSTGALVAILLCIIILLTLVVIFAALKRHRKKEPLIVSKDDVRDNVVTYNDEGGGEEDTQAFDIGALRNPEAREENKLRRDIIPDTIFHIQRPTPLWENVDVQDFIQRRINENDADATAPPYDSLATYAYEGNDSIAESLSSLESHEVNENHDYQYLNDWGPRFKKLADMYGGDESD
ncbi:unnamed protein product [Ranitomeya imitator]|uniref:ribonuclease H n=1 Tax=Ranitomeya imitator TaxID=111125 RepID=A0ABN9LRF6_9NEOB|nr:unnamed protein product [Ranitomeya imitator]